MKPLETLRDFHNNLRKLFWAVLFLSFGMVILISLCFYLFYLTGSMKPLVIRVSDVGKAEVVSPYSSTTPASSIEVKYLAKELTETIFGFSRLTFEEDLKRIIPYVSYSLKEDLLEQYRKIASLYISQNEEFRIEVFAVIILSTNSKKVQVRVDFIKKNTNSGKDEKYYVVMLFKRCQRTIHNPFGLELLQFQEHKYLKQ